MILYIFIIIISFQLMFDKKFLYYFSASIIFLQIVSSVQIHMPIGFTIQRIGDPSMTFQQYMQNFGIGQTINSTYPYNLISLDGYQYSNNYENKISPLTIYQKCFKHILANKGSIYGNSNDQVRQWMLKQLHSNKKQLLMNVDLKYAPITGRQYDAFDVARDVVKTVLDLSLESFDGISVQFEDYNAVKDNIASSWINNFLLTIRREIPQNDFVIVFCMPATYASKIKLFKQEMANSLITYYVLQYFGTIDNTFNSYTSIFQSSLTKFRPAAVFQIGYSPQIKIDICRLLVAKQVDSRSQWNQQQYIPGNQLGSAFLQAYNKGWFGGYANMQYEADKNQNYGYSVLNTVFKNCRDNRHCYC